MSKQEQSAYIVIPTIMFDDKSLTLSDCCLYGLITSLTKKEGYCWASNEFLAESIGVSKTHVSRMLNKLEKSMHISMDHEPSKFGTMRKIFLDSTGTKDLQRRLTSESTGKPDNPQVKTRLTSESKPLDLEVNQYSNKNKKSNTTLSLSENSKKSDHRNQDGTLDVNGFLNSVKSESEPKEAPPVADTPPEMDEFEMQDEAVRILTQKATLSRERYEIQQMMAKHKRTFEEMQEEAGRFAAWYVTNMIEADESDFGKILNKAKTLTRAQVQTIYTSKFWSRKYGSPQNRNQNGTATHKKKSTRLTDEGFRERYGDLVDQLNADEGITVPNGDHAGAVDEIESLPVTNWIEVGSSVFG